MGASDSSGPAPCYNPEIETLDSALNGALRLIQPKQGYRFSVDALLLAAWAPTVPDDLVLDIGAGCGVVGLLMAHRGKASRVLSIEIQGDLAVLADRNTHLNGLENRVQVLRGDVREVAKLPDSPKARLVLANPPFFALGHGRENPDYQASHARREHHGSLAELVAAMRAMMGAKASLVMVYAVERLAELFGALRAARLEPKRLRFIHGRADLPARRVLVEARPGLAGGLGIEPPLILEAHDGSPSAEAAALYAGEWL